jgi:hypothetical protein
MDEWRPDTELLPGWESRPSEPDRREFRSRLGYAVWCYCPSCHKRTGFVGTDNPAIIPCKDCIAKYGGIPLPGAALITIYCNNCHVAPKAIPNELLSKVVYYCDPCERILGKPPLEEVEEAPV